VSFKTSDQSPWFGSWNNGILFQSKNSWTTINETNGLPKNTVTDVLLDNSGTLWIGIYGSGLFHISTEYLQKLAQPISN
jgi:ligand-binding sensor domain-containing protein